MEPTKQNPEEIIPRLIYKATFKQTGISVNLDIDQNMVSRNRSILIKTINVL